MKIGLVRRGFSATGGAEKYLYRLIVALEGAGHECVLFAGREWPAERRPSGGVIPIRGRGPREFADRLAAIGPRKHCDLLFSLERVWQCDAYRAGDGVHRSWLRRRAAAEPGWKKVLRIFNGKHRQILALERSMLKKQGAGRVIANSRFIKDEIVREYGYPADQISVVYNGLPGHVAHPPTAEDRAWSRASLELGPDEFVVLFAGTGWLRKGLKHAVRAVGELPTKTRARLLVAGRGVVGPVLHGQRPEARERTRFLGPVASMQPLYAAADVFVLPTHYDPFSNGCLEALAAGLPVITTRCNGFSEILAAKVDGETIAAPDDEAGINAALAAWSDGDFRAANRDRRIAKAAGFSIERNVSETLTALGAT